MHTQAFIDEMEQLLLEEQKTLLTELQESYPEYGRSEEDNVTEMEDYQALIATMKEAKQRLEEVDEALLRIKHATYGITEDGEEISEDRLRANPAAKTIIS